MMSRDNSYDFIRLMAAIAVIFSHSFALTGNKEPSLGPFSLGTIAVWVFFILSGYLISKSWDQYPRFNVFFAKRILRILPGLIAVTIFTVIIAGLFLTTLPFFTFIFSYGALQYFNNFLLFNSSYTLPGVFDNNIAPYTVNGSIWTLAYEFAMYISVALIGVFKLYKKISPFYLWLILLTLEAAKVLFARPYFDFIFLYLNFGDLITLALMFFSGVISYKYADRIKLKLIPGLSSLLIFLAVSLLMPKYTVLFAAIFLAYAIFALGKQPQMSWVGKIGDFSYGLYIYAFFVQQVISYITNTHNPYKMFAASLVVTFVLAIASWYLVESKALKLKDKINTKKYPIIQTDNAW